MRFNMHFIQCYKNWYKNKDPLFYVILITFTPQNLDMCVCSSSFSSS